MAEGQVSGQPEQNVEADGEDAEDRKTLHQVRVARVELGQRRVFRKGLQEDRRQQRQADDNQQEPGIAPVKSEQFHGLTPPSRRHVPTARADARAG